MTHEPGQHRACMCGGVEPCSCTPSPGIHVPDWWPTTHRDWRLAINAITALDRTLSKRLDNVLKEIKKMGDATTASLAHLADDLHKVADVITALKADNDALRANNASLTEALASADADKAAAVAAQAQADDNADAAAVDEADGIIHDLVNQADNPPAPVEEPPADGGDVPPADSGDAPADGSV